MENIIIDEANCIFSKVAIGSMRITDMPIEDVEKLYLHAVKRGITFIDTADVYGKGEIEEVLGKILKRNPGLRNKVYLQTKTGIMTGERGQRYYSFEKKHIIESVNRSLDKLKTTYIDSLLLHKPDQLFDPVEVSDAFDELYKSGKVLNFGVSNMNAPQLDLLRKYCKRPIVINQMKFSLTHTQMIDSALAVNTESEYAVDRGGNGVLDYCRYHDILIQAYSIVRSYRKGETFINNEYHKKLNEVMERFCIKYNTNKNAISLAWVLRHPAKIQAVIGTSNVNRLDEYLDAFNFTLSREDWYELYAAEGKFMP